MMVTWKDFTRRRKVNLEMFKTYSYEDYSQWCVTRYVEPVSQEAFEGVKEMVAKPVIAEEVVTVSTHIFNPAQLKKMKKNGLIQLCKEQGVLLDGSETKSVIVSMLLSLNNSR